MIRVYIAALFAAFVLFAYVMGTRVGAAQCQADIAGQGAESINLIIKQVQETEDVAVKTDADNIRRVLRARYTIAE